MSQKDALRANGLQVKAVSQWFYYNAHVRERIDMLQKRMADRSVERAVLSLEKADERLLTELNRSASDKQHNATAKYVEMWIRRCGGFNDKLQIDDITRQMRELPNGQILDHVIAQVQSNPLLKRALLERLHPTEPESDTTH